MTRSAAVLLSVFLAGAVAPPVHAAGSQPWTTHRGALERADSLIRANAAIGALGLLDSLAALARARGDDRLFEATEVQRAAVLLSQFRADDAEKTVRAVLPAIESAREIATWCRALRLLGRADLARNRAASADSSFRLALRLARDARMPLEEGRARLAIGAAQFRAQRYAEAEAEFRTALRVLPAAEARTRMTARAELARCLQSSDDLDGARREHQQVAKEARRVGEPAQLGDTEYNLGSLEHTSGDPSLAGEHYRRALEIYRALHWPERIVVAANALAILDINRGRLARADSVLAIALPEALRLRDPAVRGQVLAQTGVLRRQQERFGEAVELGRRAVALNDSVSVTNATMFVGMLHATLDRAGRSAEDLALFDEQLARLDRRLTPAARSGLLANRAMTLRKLGRPREAIAGLRGFRSDVATMGAVAGGDMLRHSAELARCWRDLGQGDSARVWFGRTVALWENIRRAAGTPEWREALDDAALNFTAEYGAALLDPARGGTPASRASAAFDTLQRFRARTLDERAERSGSAAGGVLDALRAALHRGEVFLDIHAMAETTIVFAVTAEGIEAYGAAGRGAWRERLRRYTDLLTSPAPTGGAARDVAAADLGRTLFAPAAGRLRAATRVIVAAGALARSPLSELILPGEWEPMLAGREVVMVPSARMLVGARREPAAAPATPAAARSVLAIACTRDDRGRPLPGTRREARSVVAAYAGAAARVDGATLPLAALLTDAANYDVLHFATHTRADPKEPWKHALLLGAPGRSVAWLDAATIAAQRPRARLCVLSGCTTVGGLNSGAETLAGLATAWIAAGVPTVIATQWAVEDESAAELMRRFYAGLARGATASAALRGAQLELRAIPRFSHPYYWAGVVLIGDPDTRIRLTPRAGWASATGSQRPAR